MWLCVRIAIRAANKSWLEETSKLVQALGSLLGLFLNILSVLTVVERWRFGVTKMWGCVTRATENWVDMRRSSRALNGVSTRINVEK